MKVCLVIYLLLCSTALHGLKVISLGNDCQTAGHLRANNLRTQAYPFDWLQTLHFGGLYKVIEDDFKFFLDERYLIKDGPKILNTYYNIGFWHDFPTDQPASFEAGFYEGVAQEDFLSHISKVNEKYKRRIDRFLALLKSDEFVIFIRSHLKAIEALGLVKLFKNKFPHLKFILVAIVDKYDNELVQSDWNQENLHIFFVKDEHIGEWHSHKWWSEDAWARIFSRLNLVESQVNVNLKLTDEKI